jgi:hypothetical protein
MTRSILAIVIGFVVIAALSLCTDAVVRMAWPSLFRATGGSSNVLFMAASLVYVGIYAIGGCYLTARLAPNHPMRHALILGVLGLLFTLPATVAMWHTEPAWYSVVGLVTVVPYAWIGGWLRERQLGRPAA